MNVVFNLDGTRMKLQALDLDGDGVTGGVERVNQDYGTQNIVQPTELGETLKQLNDDNIDGNSRMSGIDMRSRLHPSEISSVLAVDTLVALHILPTACLAFSRQKKRLAVSIMGKGREDIVNIVAGKREQENQSQGFGEKLKGMFSPGGSQ